MLIKARDWAKKYFVAGSQPAKNTLLNWARSNVIEAQFIGGLLYIEDKPPSAMKECTNKMPEKPPAKSHNPLIVGKFTLRDAGSLFPD